MKRIFTALLTLGALLGAIGETKAQFSMSGIGQDAKTTVAIPLAPGEIDVSVINESQARMLRRKAWHARNNVDFKVGLTGMVTQFNKSWTTNNQNNVSSELSAYYYHVHSRDIYTSTFRFDGIYGMNFIDDIWFKYQDKLELYHLSSWKMTERRAILKNWAYGFSVKFWSQFAKGYKGRGAEDRNTLWSNFMAPGTINAGLGFTYTSPNSRLPFVVTINPISGDALFVLDETITWDRRQALGIPVTFAADDADKQHPIFKKYKIEGGSSLNVDFNRTFVFGDRKALSLQYITTLNSFYGWMTQVARHKPVDGSPAPPAIRPTLGWTNRLIFNPLKFLSMEFRTTTLYDRSQVNRVQMQYYLRVGLTYRYKNR